jgi:hypothetical protein
LSEVLVIPSLLVVARDDAVQIDLCSTYFNDRISSYAEISGRTIGELALLLGTGDPALLAELDAYDRRDDSPPPPRWQDLPVTERDLGALGDDIPDHIRQTLIPMTIVVDNIPRNQIDRDNADAICILSDQGWSGCIGLNIANPQTRTLSAIGAIQAPPGSRLEVAVGPVSFDMKRSGVFVTAPTEAGDGTTIHATLGDNGNVASLELIDPAAAQRIDPTLEAPGG